jgi:CRP-like cAMP-binding protein
MNGPGALAILRKLGVPAIDTADAAAALGLSTAAASQTLSRLAHTGLIRSIRHGTTKVGTFSIRHVAPEVFGGYEETERGVKLATAEKALFDFAYLSSSRSRLFTSLPELELPRGFRRKELSRWLAKIPSSRSRTLTMQKLDGLLAKAGVSGA